MADLDQNQLEMVMHVANGLTIEEIADKMSFSSSNVGKRLRSARKSVGAESIPHLVSIVIAKGLLYYSEDDNTRSMEEPT